MKYSGGKNAPGVFQRIISEIPRHRVFVELFGGSAAITRYKRPAERTIVVERDAAAVARFGVAVRQAVRDVEILVEDVFAWIARAKTEIDRDWCLYADPPYHPETLRGPQKYRCKFDADDHLRLVTMLTELPCPVLISGYRHQLYDEMLATWRRVGYWTYDRTGRRRSESLWCNFPRPRIVHDPRYLGRDRRERETRRRRITTFAGRIRRADDHELQCLAGLLDAEMDRRRLEYFDADLRDAAGGDAGSGGGREHRLNGRRSTDAETDDSRSRIDLRPETLIWASQPGSSRGLMRG